MKRHLVTYVENCSPKIKTFKRKYEVVKFIQEYRAKYPDPSSGYWIDLAVYDIMGDILEYA